LENLTLELRYLETTTLNNDLKFNTKRGTTQKPPH